MVCVSVSLLIRVQLTKRWRHSTWIKSKYASHSESTLRCFSSGESPSKKSMCLRITLGVSEFRARREYVHKAWLISNGAEQIGRRFESLINEFGCGDNHLTKANSRDCVGFRYILGKTISPLFESSEKPDSVTNKMSSAVKHVLFSDPLILTKSRRLGKRSLKPTNFLHKSTRDSLRTP